MAGITLDGNNYTHIIGTEFAEVKRVHLPEWINIAGSDPEILTNVWNEGVLKITYMLRASDAEKWELDQDLLGHILVNLTDAFYTIDHDVWVSKITAVYERRINNSKPWRITVELIYC